MRNKVLIWMALLALPSFSATANDEAQAWKRVQITDSQVTVVNTHPSNRRHITQGTTETYFLKTKALKKGPQLDYLQATVRADCRTPGRWRTESVQAFRKGVNTPVQDSGRTSWQTTPKEAKDPTGMALWKGFCKLEGQPLPAAFDGWNTAQRLEYLRTPISAKSTPSGG